jgi:hypothetical protein
MRTKQQKALAEQRFEFQQWRRWRREQLEALLAGPYGVSTQSLLAFCKTMTSPSALINFVKAGPWHNADADTRFEILSLLDAVIVKRRERIGLAPFDDTLPWSDKPDNVFLIVREHFDGGTKCSGPGRAQTGGKQ